MGTEWKLKVKMSIIIMMLGAVWMFAGCGEAEETHSEEERLSEYVYVSEFYSPNENIDTISVWENTIYYGTSEGVFYAWNAEEGAEPEKMNISVPESERYNWGVIQPDFQGNFYLIYNVDRYGEGEKIPAEELADGAFFDDTYLAKYDAEGKELFCERLVGDFQNCYINSTAVDEAGHLFILGEDKVALYDIDCSYKEMLQAPNGKYIDGVANNEKGTVFVEMATAANVIREVSFEEGILEETYENYAGGNGFFPFQENGFLSTLGGKLYLYDKTTQVNEELLKWMNCDIDTDQVEKFGALKDGRIVVLLEDEENGILGEIAVLTKTLREDAPQKEIITVGTFGADANIMRAVARFNRHSDEYKVEIIEYYNPYLDRSMDSSQKDEAYTQFHLDIVSDRCPDILNLEYDELQEYVDDGLFEDLTPYLENSSLAIMPSVTDAYTFDGKLLALPTALKIRTIAGRTSQLDGKTEWTLEEWMDFIESHPDENVIRADAQSMLEYCLMLNLSAFIDKEENTCNFTSDSFYELLEFCNSFSNGKSYSSASIFKVPNGNELLYELEFDQANDITLLSQLFRTDKITFIGFPTVDGSAGNVLEAKGGSYSISCFSENKEGAWSFLEMLLTDTVKVSLAWTTKNTGFPVEENTCQEYFRLAMENPYDEYGDRNYESVLVDPNYNLYYYVPLQEETDILLEMLETAQIAKDRDGNIINIILEETESYFSGQKTVNEAAEIIQSRVTVYLDEKR